MAEPKTTEDDTNVKPEELEQKPDELEQEDEQVDEQEEDEQEQEDESEEEDDPKPPSRREQLRIQQLLSKFKEDGPESKKKPNRPEALDYKDELDADEAVIEKLTTDRDTFGEQMYRQGLEQAKSLRFHTRLEIDAPRVEVKYPQLDKTSDDFKPALANAINQMYLSAVGYDSKTDTVQNPDIRYAEYVESMFELADEMGSQRVEATRQNIKKQAGSTGLRPDGSAPKRMNLNKAPADMTDEELAAVINQAMPK